MLTANEGKFWVWWNAYDRGKWAFDDSVNDVVKAAFLAGMEAAQQSVQADGAYWTCPCGMQHRNDSLSCPYCESPRR